MTTLPRFVRVSLIAALVSLLLSVGVAWQIQRLADAEAQRDCERAVTVREDGRAMWLYLVGTNTGATPAEQAKVDAFVAELDRLLPQLKCVDGDAVPDRDPDQP